MMKFKFNTIYNPLLLSLPLLSAGAANAEKKPVKPNIVLILADDMGYGDISCYNKNSTPTPCIDRLADEGIRFTDFYAPTPYSAPSRASLLTGRFPLRHGMIENPAPDAGIDHVGISPKEVTLAELLKGAGYKTKCIGKWHLGHKPEFFPVKNGFDEYFGILYSNDMRPVQLIENTDTVEYPVDQRLLTQRYTAKATEFISRNHENPFFLYLAHAMPHKPVAASEKFFKDGTPSQLYSAAIRELDWSTGQIVNKLKELGILENTIIIFMSDNGPWYGGSTGGLKGMKATNWEGGTRVPFIIRYPAKIPVAKTIKVPCWSPDIFPTIAGLVGVRTDSEITLDGQDITNIMLGKTTKHAPVFTMKNNRIQTIRAGKWKLFVSKPEYYKEIDPDKWSDPRAPDGKTIIAPEQQATPFDYPGVKPLKMNNEILLFDMETDPSESIDLSGKYPGIVNMLIEEYQTYLLKLKK